MRMRFADETLSQVVLPALAHLETTAIDLPDLTIGLGDLAASGLELEFPCGKSKDVEPQGAMWRHQDARFFALSQKETNSLSLVDAEEKLAFYWTRDATQLPPQEAGFPVRHLLANFLQRRDRHIVHAAAVGNETGAVLVVGKGGSGKSTTAIACAMNGLSFLGDDYTIIGLEPKPRVWSLYSSAKMGADTLSWFPQLKPFIHHAGGEKEKSLLFVHGAPGLRFAESLPIRAVLWPRITGRAETRLTPASPKTLLLALAPSSILQTPGGGDLMLRALNRLIQSVPAFILDAGTNPTQIASAIKAFLSK